MRRAKAVSHFSLTSKREMSLDQIWRANLLQVTAEAVAVMLDAWLLKTGMRPMSQAMMVSWVIASSMSAKLGT